MPLAKRQVAYGLVLWQAVTNLLIESLSFPKDLGTK